MAEYKKKTCQQLVSCHGTYVFIFSASNHSNGEDPMDAVWNTLLCNFQDMRFRLKHVGARLEKHLEKTRMSSYS
jgi:hypothetical protein